MHRNKLINEEDVGRTDRVIQTDPTNVERDVDKTERVVQTDATNFEEQEKKLRLLVMTVKRIHLSQKNHQLIHLSR